MFDRLCDELIGAGLGVHAIEMIYKGRVVLHECFDGDRAYPVYSAAKSVTSMAFSLCLRTLLTPNTRSFFPSALTSCRFSASSR